MKQYRILRERSYNNKPFTRIPTWTTYTVEDDNTIHSQNLSKEDQEKARVLAFMILFWPIVIPFKIIEYIGRFCNYQLSKNPKYIAKVIYKKELEQKRLKDIESKNRSKKLEFEKQVQEELEKLRATGL